MLISDLEKLFFKGTEKFIPEKLLWRQSPQKNVVMGLS
jgi:hypothetical protein